ncbi:hypothetical protein SLS59_004857 [Nothophoma quercina]|uniref:Uncharacterized protein n=1 Tax=Nothophoma quercina TaxID=749835 RepID=A0ABR3RCI5_9PLEO
MRYALIFAGVAAAYDAYSYDGYAENKVSSSTPAVKYSASTPAHKGYGDEYKTSSAPVPSKSSTSPKVGYTTITPGYGKEPVTVTSQYQPYPTCGAAGSDGKSCEQWNEDKYVSTVINDYNSKKVTVTYVEKPITVYQTKTTITHYPTASASGGKDGKAYPTGSYGYDDKKNGTKPWYEMQEKIHEIPYKNLGAHGLPGYGGSGLCKSCDDEQPYKVKEYKDGKWSEYQTTAMYKAPTADVKTYSKTGVYTEPAKDVTVTYTVTKPSEATTTAKAGVPVTYGGYTTDFKETGVKTCAYGAYETGKDSNGKDVTSTVVKTVTVTVSTTGKYEVAKPTTTTYAQDTEVKYATVSVYQPGVYHKDAQTVTVTKAGQTASCDYKQTKTYPAEPKKTPANGDEYPHGGDKKSSSKPSVETKTEYKPDYPASTPSVPKSNSKPYDEYATSSKPAYSKYPESSSTPVYDDKKPSGKPSAPAHDDEYPHGDKTTSSKPSVPTYSAPAHDNEYPHGDKTSSKPSVPTYSAPAHDNEYPHGDKTTSSKPSVPTYSAPAHDNEYPHGDKTSTKPYVPEHPASSSTPCPSSTKPVDSKSTGYAEYPSYPVASSSAPAHDAYPTPTPAHHQETQKSYAPEASKTTSAYPVSSTPAAKKDGSYETSKGYGYSKRAGVVQRRQAAVAKRSEIVV